MLRRLIACATAFAFYAAGVFTPALETRALASQSSLLSPTTGTVSGLQLTNNYNNAIDSINTMNSGATAPTNQLSGSPSLGNWWLNTTTNPYPAQVYDGANWLTPFWIDVSNHYTDVKIGGGRATIASSSTVDLCNGAPQAYITISGTTTITSFGSTCNAGHVKLITFSGSLALTYNSTSLIIPGNATITTQAGDQAIVVALGSGNWQVLNYTPASGQALINPAVPVGTFLWYAGYTIPTNFVEGYGQAISRTTYANYFAAVTSVQSVTATSGSPTLTGFSDTTRFGDGQAVEASFLPTGTTIQSCTATTCTLSANATASTTGNVTVFLYGDGNGSTTVNLPDCRGETVAGRDNIGGTAKNVAQVTTSISTTSGSPTATVTSATGIAAGQYVISANVPPGTQIAAGGVNGTTITLTQNATATASGTTARFSSTLDAQMMGSNGGQPTHVQAPLELPNVNFPASVSVTPTDSVTVATCDSMIASGPGSCGSAAPGYIVSYGLGDGPPVTIGHFTATGSGSGSGNATSGGAAAPMLQQNPTLVLTCIVRVSRLFDRDLPASNDNRPLVADRLRLAA